MITRVASVGVFDALVLFSYRSFLAKIYCGCDVGAQETCHMLLKFPLVVCSHKFVPFNDGNKIFQILLEESNAISCEKNFFELYQN